MNINIEELKKATSGFTNELLAEVCAKVQADTNAFAEANRRFNDDLERRQSNLRSGDSESAKRLNGIAARRLELTDQIGDAYSEGNTDAASTLEKQLEELAGEEYALRSRTEHMKQVKVRGDRGLLEELLTAHSAYLRSAEESRSCLWELIVTAQHQAEVLTRFANEAKRMAAGTNANLGCGPDLCVVNAAEAMIGPFDMSGNTCSGDEREKARIIRGNPNGVEDTPAYKKWTEFLNGGRQK